MVRSRSHVFPSRLSTGKALSGKGGVVGEARWGMRSFLRKSRLVTLSFPSENGFPQSVMIIKKKLNSLPPRSGGAFGGVSISPFASHLTNRPSGVVGSHRGAGPGPEGLCERFQEIFARDDGDDSGGLPVRVSRLSRQWLHRWSPPEQIPSVFFYGVSWVNKSVPAKGERVITQLLPRTHLYATSFRSPRPNNGKRIFLLRLTRIKREQ